MLHAALPFGAKTCISLLCSKSANHPRTRHGTELQLAVMEGMAKSSIDRDTLDKWQRKDQRNRQRLAAQGARGEGAINGLTLWLDSAAAAEEDVTPAPAPPSQTDDR